MSQGGPPESVHVALVMLLVRATDTGDPSMTDTLDGDACAVASVTTTSNWLV